MNIKPEISRICLLLLALSLSSLISCALDDPTGLRLHDVITITAESDVVSLKADGVDRMLLTAQLMGETPDGSEVTFMTDAGRFAGISSATKTEDNLQQLKVKAVGRQASVYLISGTRVADATVSAKVGEYTAVTTVGFTRVDPARLVLESNTAKLKADGNDMASLTVTLVAPEVGGEESGVVTEQTRVKFTAKIEGTNTSVDALRREAVSGSNGKATTTLVGRQAGVMRITATVDGLPEISDSVLLEFE